MDIHALGRACAWAGVGRELVGPGVIRGHAHEVSGAPDAHVANYSVADSVSFSLSLFLSVCQRL